MDACEVSDDPRWIELLRLHQRTLAEAQSQKGKRPTSWVPRAEVISRFTMALVMGRVGSVRQQTAFQIKTSLVPPLYPPCIEPLSNLKKIMLKDLLLETQHRGSYLLVRTVTPQDLMTAVIAVVEDEQGTALLLQLYHQQDSRSSVPNATEDVLKPGQVLILKEPYFKLTSGGDHGLRVDHLSDVVFLADGDLRIPQSWRQQPEADSLRTALARKTEGNRYFNGSQYRSAIEW